MAIEKGCLYLCATPIGNLGDITERVRTTLEEADIIAAEDTRNTLRLLNHLNIQKKLTSYHEHNKYDKAQFLIRELASGKSIALVTDAGTPAISDPGEVLVKLCIEAGIRVTSLPGATAVITALTLSGFSTKRFVFEGFLPADKKERQAVLDKLAGETRTIVLYEAPHHLIATLEHIYHALGNRKIAVCRELTKLHEEVLHLDILSALSLYENTPPRGEYVLVIEGKDPEEVKKDRQKSFESLSVKEHVEKYVLSGMDKKEAMKKTATDRGISKRDVYNMLLKDEES